MDDTLLYTVAHKLGIEVYEVSSHGGVAYDWGPKLHEESDNFRSFSAAEHNMLVTLREEIEASYKLLKVVHEAMQ